MKLMKIIEKISKIASFTNHEHLLHPFLVDWFNSNVPDCIIHRVPDNNLIIEIPGKKNMKPIALSAHLDKIDHDGVLLPEQITLPYSTSKEKLFGHLDDSVGVGVICHLAEWSQRKRTKTPPLYILLSEKEECGLQGAINIASYMNKHLVIPDLFINIDVTPKFGSESGVCVYGDDCGLQDEIYSLLKQSNPNLKFSTGINDYIIYQSGFPESSVICIEPAIKNIHSNFEECWKKDIEEVVKLSKIILSK